MRVERIQEPIRVLAEFTGGSARPVRFQWAGRTRRVQAVNAQWVDRQGAGYALHFSVQADGQTCFLHFDSVAVQWWLDEVVTD